MGNKRVSILRRPVFDKKPKGFSPVPTFDSTRVLQTKEDPLLQKRNPLFGDFATVKAGVVSNQQSFQALLIELLKRE